MKKISRKALKNLTRQQKEDLLDTVQQVKVSQQVKKIETYNNPDIIGEHMVHHVQVDFHKCLKELRFFFGGNRCLAAGSRIMLPNERSKPIEEVVAGDIVLAVDPDTLATYPCKVSEVFDNGVQPCFKYSAWGRDAKRRTLWCTPNHHILTEVGLQEAGYINHNTNTLRPKQIHYNGQDDPLAYALGYCYGRRSPRKTAVTYLVSDTTIQAIIKFYRDTPFMKCFQEVHPGELSIRGPRAPRFNKLATDLPELRRWAANTTTDALLDFADGFIDTRAMIDRYAVSVFVRNAEEQSLLLRTLRAMGAYAPVGFPTGTSTGDGQRMHRVQLQSASDITRLLINLKLHRTRDLMASLQQQGVVNNAFLSYQAHVQESYWNGPAKTKPQMVKTYDLKLADGNNLYIANEFIVGNSGKTEAGAVEAYWYASGTHPHKHVSVPNNGRIIVESLELFEQDIVPKFRKWAPNFDRWTPIKGHQGKTAGYILPNGSRIDVFTFNQESAKLEGTSIRWAWANEPPPQQHVVATIRGLIDQRGQMWMTLTPLSEPYLYTDFYLPAVSGERDDIAVFESSIFENPWLDKKYIDWYIKNIPEEDKASRVYGKFRFLSGRVFKEFEPSTHVVDDFEWPAKYPITVGIDPHLRKPHVAVFLGVNRKGFYVVVDELEVAGDIEDLGHAIAEKALKNKYNIQNIVADSFISQPDAHRIEPRVLLNEVLENAGLPRVQIAKKKNTKTSSISELKRLLKIKERPEQKLIGPDLLFMRKCRLCISNMMAYVYAPAYRPEVTGPSEEPIKTNDDAIDALRYALIADPYFEANMKQTYRRALETYGGRTK